jgi:hypothetical protein
VKRCKGSIPKPSSNTDSLPGIKLSKGRVKDDKATHPKLPSLVICPRSLGGICEKQQVVNRWRLVSVYTN